MFKRKNLLGVFALISSVLIVLSIFIGTAGSAQAANDYNNEGISADTNTRSANFDGGGYSYSNTALANAGFQSGATIKADGFTFQWPGVAAGTNDNWQADGQVVPVVANGSVLALIGSATSGVATGTATITYADNSTQAFPLTMSDWTLNAGKAHQDASNRIVATMSYRNAVGGQQGVMTYLFLTTMALQSGKTIKSVTLPATTTGGKIHIFAVTTGNVDNTGLNNEGISRNSNSGSADFDGGGYSYSNDALTAAGFASGANVKVKGAAFQWPAVSNGSMDNWQAAGQVIPLTGSGAVLGLLGAASSGTSSGNIIVTYSDGSTQTSSVTMSDWTLSGGNGQLAGNNSVAVALSYRNSAHGGRQNLQNYIFYTGVTLTDGKTIKSVTLPSSVSGGQMHIFAVGLGVAAPPSFNNEGIADDANYSSGNFDGAGYSYSNQALAGAGFRSGAIVNVKGAMFQWPVVGAGMKDNWQAGGQVIPVAAGGSSLAFLGAATNGSQNGTATITYTDGSTQQFTLALSDWSLGAGTGQIAAGDAIAATMSYRNGVHSSGRNNIATYLFYSKFALDTNKTIKSVTLPNNNNMHVFAITTQNFQEVQQTSSWPTYVYNTGHSGDNTAETTLNAGNIGHVRIKWASHGDQGMSMQPVEANNTIYWGTWDGYMHATTTSGIQLWNTAIGQTVASNCVPPTAAIGGTAIIGNVGSTPAVFVGGGGNAGGGDGHADYYALDANTGKVLWKTALGSAPDNFIWGSGTLSNGSIYIGLSSFGDCPLTQGKVFKINAETGAIQGTFKVVPDGCLGGGVWGTPTISPDGAKLYVATGTYRICNVNGAYSAGVVELRTSDMSVLSVWRIPYSEVHGTDLEFGSAPTLYSATVNGGHKYYVGVSAKDGQFYVFYQDLLSNGPIHKTTIADSGNCPQCGSGAIAPAVYDGSTIYVAGGHVTINGVSCKGSVDALDLVTGAYKWRRCLNSGPVLGPLSGFPGVVLVTQGNQMNALSMANGNILYTYTDSAPGSTFYSGVSVASGLIYVPDLNGDFVALGL